MPTSSSSSSAKEEEESLSLSKPTRTPLVVVVLLMLLLLLPAPLALTAPPRRRAEERETPVDATDGAARAATLLVPLPRLPLLPPVLASAGASGNATGDAGCGRFFWSGGDLRCSS